MKGRIIDFSFGMNRKCRVTVELDENFQREYDRLKDCDLEISIKKYRKKRSLDANAYAWALIAKIAQRLQVEKEFVYRETIRNIGGVSDTVCVQDAAVKALTDAWTNKGLGWQVDNLGASKIPGCTNLVLYYGSSTYDTEQMSRLIDLLVQDAKELGIETLSERELSLLKANEIL